MLIADEEQKREQVAQQRQQQADREEQQRVLKKHALEQECRRYNMQQMASKEDVELKSESQLVAVQSLDAVMDSLEKALGLESMLEIYPILIESGPALFDTPGMLHAKVGHILSAAQLARHVG